VASLPFWRLCWEGVLLTVLVSSHLHFLPLTRSPFTLSPLSPSLLSPFLLSPFLLSPFLLSPFLLLSPFTHPVYLRLINNLEYYVPASYSIPLPLSLSIRLLSITFSSPPSNPPHSHQASPLPAINQQLGVRSAARHTQTRLNHP
jgi:hypothetical protein